jgi:protein-tyrosine phosphatase
VTEILKDQLWLCGIGELKREIFDVRPYAILNVSQPDDFMSWEDPCSDMVDLYIKFPFPDGPLPDMDDLHRLAGIGAALLAANKRIVVHCAAGHNRSGLLTALILRQLHNMTGSEAATFIQAKRKYVLWNKKYIGYLNELQQPNEMGMRGLVD